MNDDDLFYLVQYVRDETEADVIDISMNDQVFSITVSWGDFSYRKGFAVDSMAFGDFHLADAFIEEANAAWLRINDDG